MQGLHNQILTADPGLDLGVTAETSQNTPARPPDRGIDRQLPANLPDFTGRAGETGRLHDFLIAQSGRPGSIAIAALAGTGGVGKTALAVHVAHQVAAHFSDGQLFISLFPPRLRAPDITSRDDAREWLGAEQENLVRVVALAQENGMHESCWKLAWFLRFHLDWSGRWGEGLTVARTGVAAAKSCGTKRMLDLLECLELFRDNDLPYGEGMTLAGLGDGLQGNTPVAGPFTQPSELTYPAPT